MVTRVSRPPSCPASTYTPQSSFPLNGHILLYPRAGYASSFFLALIATRSLSLLTLTPSPLGNLSSSSGILTSHYARRAACVVFPPCPALHARSPGTAQVDVYPCDINFFMAYHM